MLTPPTQAQRTDASQIEVQHNKALAMFEAAEVVLNRTKTKNPKLILAKKALYRAETIDEYVAAAKLFEGTATHNPRIAEGSRLVKAAAKIVKNAAEKSPDARPVLAAVDIGSPAASPAAGPCAGGAAKQQASPQASPAPSIKQERSPAVKRASPAAPPASAAAPPVFPRMPPSSTARIVESAPATQSWLHKGMRVVLSAAHKVDFNPFVSKVHAPAGGSPAKTKQSPAPPAQLSDDDKPLKPACKKHKPVHKRLFPEAPKQAKQARQASPECIVIGSSDDEDAGKQPALGGAAKAALPAQHGKQPALGGAAQAAKPAKPAKVVHAMNNGFWTSAVIDLMTTLKKRGFYSFQLMNSDAEDQMATLPEHIALNALAELLNEANVYEDANAFLIERAEQLRAEHGIAGVFDVYAEIAADADATESDDE